MRNFFLIVVIVFASGCDARSFGSVQTNKNLGEIHLEFDVGVVFRDPLSNDGFSPEMVVLPAGEFIMGSPQSEWGRHHDESPQTNISIPRPFAVGKYEVTWGQWLRCVNAGGCSDKGQKEWGYDEGYGLGDMPVINVSWYDAQDYVEWLSAETGKGYRLLSEAEWEYAARAGTTGAFSNDGGLEELCTISNHDDLTIGWTSSNHLCADGYRKTTAQVGSFKPNSFGLYDMHGNVHEWVQDCYVDNLRGVPKDGSARTSRCQTDERVMRGGSMFYPAHYHRSASRSIRYTPNQRYGFLGFRIAREISSKWDE